MLNTRISIFLLFIISITPRYINAINIYDTAIINNDTIIKCKYISSKGCVKSISQYLNGREHGEQVEYFDNGNIESITKYKQGCPVDTGYRYFKSGKIRSINIYLNCNDNSMSYTFYESGDTQSVGLQNIFKSFHPHHLKASIMNYNSSGQKHGLCETWREDGTRRDSVVYNNGEFVEERVYFANGNVRYHLVYGDTVKVRRVCYAGSIDTLDELTVANATFYSFKNGKIISSIKSGKGFATWCDSIGNNCSTETYLWGIEIETEKKICARPENAGPSALPEKGKCDCWVDIVGKVEK